MALLGRVATDDVGPNTISFNAAISACEKGSEWAESLALFGQDGQGQGRCQAKYHQLQRRIQRFRDGKRVGRGIGTLWAGWLAKGRVRVNTISYSAGISACEMVGEFAAASALSGRMAKDDVRPNTISDCAAISACAKGGNCAEAVAPSGRMAKADVEMDTFRCNVAISACEKSRSWAAALALLGRMARGGVKANAVSCSAAISACEKGSVWSEALALLSTMAKTTSRWTPSATVLQSVLARRMAAGHGHCRSWAG